ncbi:hypothetical protein ASG31_13685 [Chryseobacterium sp. Leaf404]|uniref:hypothetical protein n=1 Tax=unclassified Chryseobacterium TaxID=2593645 RepID=UPI0006FAE31D|nr:MULTISPECIES: hypothetical protein [unclassified Chryseobacterium]KQT16024.1 hypothetical protein ASG31_13685 [Chryseobacterium sp. Leaf404]
MFEKLFRKKEPDSQLISVIEYPKNYTFETYFKIETGLWKRTDLITICEKNTGESNLNNLILKHLNYSKCVKEKNIDFKEMYENYKKLTSHSSIKKQMKDSKSVQIFRNDQHIIFTPTKNGGTSGHNRGYTEIAERKIIIDKNSENLASCLLMGFKECE